MFPTLFFSSAGFTAGELSFKTSFDASISFSAFLSLIPFTGFSSIIFFEIKNDEEMINGFYIILRIILRVNKIVYQH